MRSSLARRAITLLLTHSLLCSFVFAQQQSKEESRPRRVQTEWPITPPSTSVIPVISTPVITSLTGPEPKIRVALSTDARSAVISSTSHLLNTSAVSYTHLRAHETPEHLVCRLL